MNDLTTLEQQLNITFQDKSLLMQAMVHSSYINEHPEFHLPSNERLEFLGDAFLGFTIAYELFQRYPQLSEGKMTRLRSAVVCQDVLSQEAEILSIGTLLHLGKGEEESGGRLKQRNLAGALEALFAAILLDQDWEKAKQVVLNILGTGLERVIQEKGGIDFKSQLQELLQAKLKIIPTYQVLDIQGPEHQRLFSIEVFSGEKSLGKGEGNSKKKAEMAAAQQALQRLKTTLP